MTSRLWFLAALLMATGCASSAAATHRDAGTLVALTRADGATMNPMYAQTVQDGSIYAQLLFDGLTNLGMDGASHPALATSWTHSPDGLHWTVELRHDARWSDGVPFTSKDVVFTYRIMLDPKTAFIDEGDIDYLRHVTADGPYRVRFDLAHVSARFVDAALGEPMLPEHVLGSIPPDRQLFSSFGEHPVGTGPYRLRHWEHDSDVVFERNPYSWRAAKIPRIEFRVIFNDQAEVDALESGSADLIDDLGFDQSKRLRKESPGIKQLTFSSVYVNVVEVNLKRPGLSDQRVRQAMMYAFDRAAIARGFFDNHVGLSSSIITPALTRWFDPRVPVYPYDPARARALLDAAGWVVGPDGVRHRGATRLAFELLLNQGSVSITDQMLAFCQDLAAVGIKVDLRQLDFASTVQRAYSGKYDLLADARGGGLDPDYTAVLLSTQRPPAGANTTGYDDPVVDHDLLAGVRELDYAKRRALYDQMQMRLAETLPMLWQYGRYAGTAYSARLALDPKTTLQSPLIWYNVQDWTFAS
jgi:peptide/nickel transport system substrate-binding protein